MQSGSSSARNWTENLPQCMPVVSLTSPANGQTYSAPSSISLSATASADAGIAQVEFFRGATSLGVGTLSGGSYVLTWNTPDSGNYAITAHATDNNGITTVSVAANITVQNNLSSGGFSGGNFQFTINGSPGASVEVKASDDLAAWTSLGNVTLTGGSYVYSDTSASSYTHRFYRVQENGVCSANTIGFVSIALPAGKSVAVADPLNNPAGNLVSTLFASLPNGTLVQKWTGSGYTSSTKGSPTFWTQPGLTLSLGEGSLVKSPSAQTITFIGDVPQGTQVNSGLPATVGSYALIGSIIPLGGSVDSLGFPSQSGDIN